MKTALATICAVILLVAGCSDESECPTCPGDDKTEVPNPTLQNIWPNADKTSWTYQQEVRVWEGDITIYPTRDDIPTAPLPSWSEVFDLVESRTPVEPHTATRRIYRMQFDGVTTTGSGVTAQRRTDEVFIETAQGVERYTATHGMPRYARIFGAGSSDLRIRCRGWVQRQIPVEREIFRFMASTFAMAFTAAPLNC